MTVPSTAPRNRPLRLAGILFVVSALVSAAALATEEWMASIHRAAPDTFGPLILIVPIYAATEIASLALMAAYVALFLLQPRGAFHWIFLLASLGHAIDALRLVIPAGGVFGIVLAVVGTVGSAIYVAARRLFTPVPSLIFLITAIVGLVPLILPLVAPVEPTLGAALFYLADTLFVVTGIAMVRAARTRSTATA